MNPSKRIVISSSILWMCATGGACGGDDTDGSLGIAGSSSDGTAGTAASTAGSGSSASAGNGSSGGKAGNALADGGAGTDDGTSGTAGSGSSKPMAMDECGLNTKYDGDEYCILPPPPDQGFQLHIGPSDYDNPEAKYLLAPDQEITTDFAAKSTNTEKRYFYFRQIRMRPGAHHNIVTRGTGGVLGMGSRIATSNHLAEDSPKGGIIAPENEHVGIAIDANSAINVNLHSINTTGKPQLRELWINFWYRDAELVTEPVQQLFQTGGLAGTTFAIQPHQDTVLGPYSCSLSSPGRMLWFYGHRHANNVRFSAWRVRGGNKDLIYEGFNALEPLVLEYSSTVVNTKPDTANKIEGGWSGILDIEAGDKLQWECHVINQTDGVLRFTNNTYTGEMCIMDAELIGTNCQ